MANTGSSSKIVSSSYLFTTLQAFFTKIKTLLDGKITNNPFSGSGTSGTAGYVAFAQLVVTADYVNRPIEFELICRGRDTPCYVNLVFSNAATKDPGIVKLTYSGTGYGVFAHKIATSTWLLYYTKSEAYDNVTVARMQMASQGITITHPGTFITEKPTTDFVDCVLGGNVAYAEKSGNASTLNGYPVATASMKDTWGKIPVIGAGDGVLEVGKYIDFHTTDGNEADYDVRITASTNGLTLTGTTSGTFSGSLSGNASTATKATQDSGGQQINTTYLKGLSVSGKTITYTKGDNTTGTITTQDTNTTYTAGTGISLSGTTFSNSGVRSVATGSANGTVSVNTNGTSADVAVKGLGSAAYTTSTAYATSGHTHNYAGSSSAGGAATTALTCTGNSATATNADTLDGFHAHTFQKHLDGYITDFNTTLKDGEYSFGGDNLTGAPATGGIYGKLIVKVNDGDTHNNSTNWIWQFAYCTNGKNYWRNKVNDGTWSEWRGINDNGNATSVYSTGFGHGNFTYYQTDKEFNGNSNWCHYLIGNYGNGASDYHYMIGLPFWGYPIYKRKWDGGNSGWQSFYTTENITYGTWTLSPGSSALATGNIYLQYE